MAESGSEAKPGDLSTRPHDLLSEIQFRKGRALTWLSEGKTLPKPFMSFLSDTYYVP